MGTIASDKTTAQADTGATPATPIFVRVQRMTALSRALLSLAPAVVIASIAWPVLTDVWKDGGASSLIVDIAVSLALAPFVLGAVALCVSGFRWLLLACWPRPAGIYADATALTLALGPFGTRRYDVDRLEVRYLFECSDDEEADSYEALLPEEEQIRRYLPVMQHPEIREPLNRVVMRFLGGSESAAAARLRPMIARWRGENDAARPDA